MERRFSNDVATRGICIIFIRRDGERNRYSEENGEGDVEEMEREGDSWEKWR